MNLPFTAHPKPLPRNFSFTLEIGEGVLQTGIWTVENGKVSVIAIGSYEKYPSSSDFISAADRSLSKSLDYLKIDPASVKNVILGLPSSWLSQDKILPEKIKFLKDICHKLSLKPIGFVVTAEAIVRYLQTTEGVPPTAILIGVSGSSLEVIIARLGRIIGIHTVKRGGSITEDVKEGLSRFLPADLFPSRIILYDHGVELESLRQTLLSFAWQAPQHRLPFIHFPKIDLLPQDSAIKAISITTGLEAAKTAQPALPIHPEEVVKTESNFDNLGFVENVDLALSALPKKVVTEKPKIVRPKFNYNFNFKFKLPNFHIFYILFLLFAIILIPIVYWYYFVTAKIILTFAPQTISTRFTEKLNTSIVTTDAETEVNLPTTGSVLVGDKATGSVTIVNGTNVIKSFPSGTELISDSNLKFITTESVTVASASGTADPNSYQPGKADVKITASIIGQDSNLSAGSEFKIGSFSKLDYVARNSNALSGGTSRQAQAVAKKDLSDAKSQADADLAVKAEAAIRNSLPEGTILVDGTTTQKVISETTNYKEGEEATQLILTKKVKVEAKTYQKSDLDKIVEDKLSPQYPPNSKLLSSPKVDVTFTKTAASIEASVDLAPDLNTDELVKQLLGKSVASADSIFKPLTGLSNYSVEFQPKKMNLFKRFPYRPQNLSLFSTYSVQ